MFSILMKSIHYVSKNAAITVDFCSKVCNVLVPILEFSYLITAFLYHFLIDFAFSTMTEPHFLFFFCNRVSIVLVITMAIELYLSNLYGSL